MGWIGELRCKARPGSHIGQVVRAQVDEQDRLRTGVRKDAVLLRVREHGARPFRVAVVHGGPGAGGEMAPVARELALDQGVLEPIQTATSVEGQVQELRAVLEAYGDPPVVLIGFSWGAWLAYIVAARYSALVERLILIGSGPFEEGYVAELHQTRVERLSEKEREEFVAISEVVTDPAVGDRDGLLSRLADLVTKCDAYEPIPGAGSGYGGADLRLDVFRGVWSDAEEMRRSGELLALGRRIGCPVLAIHGSYDPHPAAGVREPLSKVLDEFRFILLQQCGHKPWVERQASEAFYRLLKTAVSDCRSAANWR